MPWKTAITLLGEDQIAQNMFKHLSVSGRTKNQRNLDINDETDNVDDVNNVESLNNNDVNRQAALHAHIPDPETAYIRKESRKELSSAISKADSELTKKQRDVYVLHFKKGKSVKETGKKLRISSPAVLHRIDGIQKTFHKHVDKVR